MFKSKKTKKVEKVINSCKTWEHYIITWNWVHNSNLVVNSDILKCFMNKHYELKDLDNYRKRLEKI